MSGRPSVSTEASSSSTSTTSITSSGRSPRDTPALKEHPTDVEKNEKTISATSEVVPEQGIVTAQPPVFPEGGLRAWLTVIGGTMVTFCTFGVVQSFGVYQDYYSRISLSEHSPSQISLIGSLQVFFVFALGLPAGRLFDAGYFHHCLLTGSIIYIFSIFMLSLAQPHHYYQNVLSQGVGMGIGMGIMFLPSLTITSHYFKKRRSMAMGVVIAGSSLGGVIYPVLLNNIFQRSPGFQWGVRAVAFMDLGFLIVANLIMRTRLPPKKSQGGEGGATFKTVLKDIPFLVYILGAFLLFWGVFVPFFYLQLYAALHGVDAMFVKYSITVMNAASIFGRIIPNFLADHYGPLNIMIPSGIITAALIFGMFGATSIGGVTAFGIFYGFFSGGLVSVVTPAVGSFITHRDLSDLGVRIGMLSFSLAFALLTGNPIAGALLTSRHVWSRPLIFAAVVVFMGALCNIMIWKTIARRRGSTKI